MERSSIMSARFGGMEGLNQISDTADQMLTLLTLGSGGMEK